MRISGWSSDLCSSDLGILVRTCGLGKRARNADADAAAPAGLNLDLLDEVSYCAYGSGIVPARRRQASASEDRAVGREGGSLDLGAAEIHPDPYDSARSEEHTSELQSLMRISYAVFCLKKKNNTKTQNKSSNEAET